MKSPAAAVVLFALAAGVYSAPATAGGIREDIFATAVAERIGENLQSDRPDQEKEPFPEEVIRKVGWAKRFRVTTKTGDLIESKTIPDISFDRVASITISKGTYAAKTAGQLSAIATVFALMIAISGGPDSQFLIKAEPAALFLGVVGSALVGGIVGSFFRQWETVYVAGRRR